MKKILLLVFAFNYLSAQTVTDYIATGLNTPSGICFDNNGNLIVGELNTYKIFRYNSTLVKTDLTPNSLFGMPNQLAFNSSTNEIWMATENFGRVSKLTAANVLTEYTAANNPYGVAIDGQGNIFYSEFLGGRIKKRQLDGTTTDFVTGLQSPTSIAFDPNGNLLVTESLNSQLLKISPAGIKTVLVTDLTDVRQIAVNTNGDIYVGGGILNRIYRIPNGQTTASTFVTNQPCRGMAIKNNELYVSNVNANKILKISLPLLNLDRFNIENNVSVFPNPLTNLISISFEKEDLYTVEVYAIDGALVFKKVLNSVENIIDLEFLNSGIYLLKISDDKTSVTKKIIKV